LLGELFGVTTDYLLKDSIEDEEIAEVAEEKPVRKISLEYANTYLAVQKKNSWLMGVATLLCILSPIVLIILNVLTEDPKYGITEEIANLVGLIVLFAFIGTAVPMFIVAGHNNEPYKFLDKTEPFDLEYGVKGILQERQKTNNNIVAKWIIVATCLSIISPIPVIVGTCIDPYSIIGPTLLAVTLFVAGISASIWVVIGMQKSAIQKLLREEDYTDKGKRRSALKQPVSFAYWGLFTVAYLIWSIAGEAWDISWLLWVAAGILYPVVSTICNHIADKQIEKENKNK
jgi:quinol-cytochrome oxidoreductase complex cytochrome b subunit